MTYHDLKFIIGDVVRISIYKNIFPKDYVPNWSKSQKHCSVDMSLLILKAKKLKCFTKKKKKEKKCKK